MRRLLVNDLLSALPGHRTFWNDLQEWFGMEFVGGDYATLTEKADAAADGASLMVRNASYFGPIQASKTVPTISLFQDIITEGPQREMQESVIISSRAVVFNSAFTASKYLTVDFPAHHSTIPLPVDFSVFEPGNTMGLQQALSLPDGCVCWVGACDGAAGQVKGWDTFIQIARLNPDIPFVAVLKDVEPSSVPPNVRFYVRVPQVDLAGIMGACRVGLCTSRMESQHLAGIEMGACGLPLVAPAVGVYWKRDDLPGAAIADPTPQAFTSALRAVRGNPGDPDAIRAYWRREFFPTVVRAKWRALIMEVECSSAS